MITKYEPKTTLRSSSKCMLVVPKIRTKGYGVRYSLYAAAELWNDLCDDDLTGSDPVAKFKARLKTHFFNKYF